MLEVWKDIPSFEGIYQISNKKRVKRLARVVNESKKGSYKLKEHIMAVDMRGNCHITMDLNHRTVNVHRMYDRLFKFQDVKDDLISPYVYAGLPKKITFGKRTKSHDVNVVISKVEIYFKIDFDDLIARNKELEVAMSRHILSYLLRYKCDLTSVKVGEIIKRDHATVLHSCKVVSNILENPKDDFYNHFNELVKFFK